MARSTKKTTSKTKTASTSLIVARKITYKNAQTVFNDIEVPFSIPPEDSSILVWQPEWFAGCLNDTKSISNNLVAWPTRVWYGKDWTLEKFYKWFKLRWLENEGFLAGSNNLLTTRSQRLEFLKGYEYGKHIKTYLSQKK